MPNEDDLKDAAFEGKQKARGKPYETYSPGTAESNAFNLGYRLELAYLQRKEITMTQNYLVKKTGSDPAEYVKAGQRDEIWTTDENLATLVDDTQFGLFGDPAMWDNTPVEFVATELQRA